MNQYSKNSELYSQINEYEKIIKGKLKNNSSKNKIQTHPQAIYTSRLLNFKNLSFNSGNYLYLY